MDPTAAAAIAAATAAVTALSEALQPGTLQHHKVSLPTFWTEDPTGWFHHAEAEFLLARIPANSYVCYMHVVRALSSEALTAVRDLIRDVTAATPDPYTLIKEALLARFTPSPLQMCFRLLDMLPLGDCCPSALFSERQALLPRDANILFNALYLRRLPESMRSALADRGDLPPAELAAAADLLLQATPLATVAAAMPAEPPATPQPPLVAAATNPSYRRRSRSPVPFRRASTPHRRAPSPAPRRRQLPRPPPDFPLCFYHYNFGRMAHRCQPPCQWQGNE
jgi:hypothetical protein